MRDISLLAVRYVLRRVLLPQVDDLKELLRGNKARIDELRNKADLGWAKDAWEGYCGSG